MPAHTSEHIYADQNEQKTIYTNPYDDTNTPFPTSDT